MLAPSLQSHYFFHYYYELVRPLVSLLPNLSYKFLLWHTSSTLCFKLRSFEELTSSPRYALYTYFLLAMLYGPRWHSHNILPFRYYRYCLLCKETHRLPLFISYEAELLHAFALWPVFSLTYA